VKVSNCTPLFSFRLLRLLHRSVFTWLAWWPLERQLHDICLVHKALFWERIQICWNTGHPNDIISVGHEPRFFATCIDMSCLRHKNFNVQDCLYLKKISSNKPQQIFRYWHRFLFFRVNLFLFNSVLISC